MANRGTVSEAVMAEEGVGKLAAKSPVSCNVNGLLSLIPTGKLVLCAWLAHTVAKGMHAHWGA